MVFECKCCHGMKDRMDLTERYGDVVCYECADNIDRELRIKKQMQAVKFVKDKLGW